MNPYAVTATGIVATALGLAAWAVAKVLAIPDHESFDTPLHDDRAQPVHLVTHDELHAARIARAKAMHPAFGTGCSVIPFPTRPTAS